MSKISKKYIRIFTAEGLGTAFIVLFCCMGAVQPEDKSSSPMAGVMAGFVICIMIASVGHISGAHANPAVSIAAVMYKLISITDALVYISAQFIGAIIGYGLLLLQTPSSFINDSDHCVTRLHPSLSIGRGLLAEFVVSSCLIFLVCVIWDKNNTSANINVPLKFGILIALFATVEGKYTGCSMNPARSFAPALYNGSWEHHWIYWVAPISAGVLVPLFYRMVFGNLNEQEDDSAEG